MTTNCPLCGRRLSVEAIRERENTILFPNGVEVVICEACGERKKELEKKVRGASPRQLEILTTKSNESLIDAILREQITLTEQPEPSPPPKPKEVKLDEYGCRIGEEKWDPDTNQCVKIEKATPTKEQVVVPYQPAPEIPAQPVVPVGPVTIEQKVAALNDKIAKFEQLLANLYGFLGQSYEEARQALAWHLGK